MFPRRKKRCPGTISLAIPFLPYLPNRPVGRTLRSAAKLAAVSERTARRRWADPAFRQRVQQLRADAVERAMGRLSGDMGRAAGKLRHLLNAEAENVRLGAAKAVIELGLKLRDSTEWENRLIALEEKLREGKT